MFCVRQTTIFAFWKTELIKTAESGAVNRFAGVLQKKSALRLRDGFFCYVISGKIMLCRCHFSLLRKRIMPKR